jgi:peptidoglycan-N-acetylglucosamine deacetylase
MRLYRPWFFAVWIFPAAIFRLKTTEKILCLTFDDGPDPLSTPLLLDTLARYNLKAVFFCSGRLAHACPELVSRIKSEGHLVGNHCYNHKDGFLTSVSEYIEDIKSAAPLTSNDLFRPPYGRMRHSQYKKIIRTYRIMMWDLMAYDFDMDFGKDNSLSVLKKKIRKGSIIVFHDKPGSTVHEFLKEFILYCFSQGYSFELPAYRFEHTD